MPPEATEDTRWIYYSSETTSAPKGIRHTDASVIAGSAGVVGMVNAGRPLFPSLRGCLAGGARTTAELGRRVRETFGVAGVANAWGMTEFPCATSPSLAAAPEVPDHAVGPPVPGVRVRVVDSGGSELRAGHEGSCGPRDPNASSATSTPPWTPTLSTGRAGCAPATSASSMPTATCG